MQKVRPQLTQLNVILHSVIARDMATQAYKLTIIDYHSTN